MANPDERRAQGLVERSSCRLTLRHRERGDRAPHGPALVLLNVIQHNPAAVIEALTA